MPCDTPSKTSNQVASLLAGPCRKPRAKGSGVADVEVRERIGEILAGGPAVWDQGDSFSVH
jgi:hypothetical protein